ncbi:hypothetical protein NLI96_g1783 [Meripilus lineatus]|uniref:Cytochrome P450 n=1 Tax=Meripilus lineatus TaxID=2056292 RepID=A0AAD5VC12_9APHY|nr:hypothetical protein NLI96_g1783 [Physisporinus lineatus]
METIRNCAGIGYPAAGDTTGSAILSLFLAMSLHPEVQQRAQEELDSVCQSRMPEFSDRQNLPYINALCIEILRWSSTVPLAFPHTTVEDDYYNGLFIPARSIVMVDSFSMNFNEETYPQPHKFDPERFLSADRKTCVVSSASSAAFSFGKRKCPGRYLADAELFYIAASVLKWFTIKPQPGVVLPVRHEELFTSEIVSSPLPFKCMIQPRGEQHDALIKDAL